MRKVSFLTLTLLAFVAASYAAPSAGKVRSVLGEVTRQKDKDANWKQLRVNEKFFNSDKIKTGEESETVLGFPDGSVITVTEKSLVVLSDLLEENGAFKTTVDVQSGRLAFSVQKQNEKSTFKFKTGTAVAAIRGTKGGISNEDDNLVSGLEEGALEITTGDETVTIKGGQSFFKRKKGKPHVLDLPSSGNAVFMKRLVNLVTKDDLDEDALIEKIRHDDSTFQAKQQLEAQNVKCNLDMLADTTTESSIILKGQCPAKVSLQLYGETLPPSETGEFALPVSLDGMSIGEKKFELICSINKVSFACGTFTTYYNPAVVVEKTDDAFNLATQSPATICNDGLVIEGSYLTTDPNASIILTIGKNFKSENLLKVADGSVHGFSHKFLLNDENGLWNETKATVTFTSSNTKQVKNIDLNVSKTCPAVNQNAPIVQFNSYDSLACSANLSVKGIKDDIVVFTNMVDDMQDAQKTLKNRNEANITVALKEGSFDYEFRAEDLAGNMSSVSKTLGCYPKNNITIRVEGNANGNNKEALRVPPPPPHRSEVITKNLRFSVKEPKNDPNNLYKVIVKQNGKPILQETKTQIHTLDYEIPVTLNKGGKNEFDIEVIGKSGNTAKAKKIYEVR